MSIHYLQRGRGEPLLLTDQPLPPPERWVRDTPIHTQTLSLAGSIAEEHALSPLLLD